MKCYAESWYTIVEDCVDKLAEFGITDVWLPPPSQSVAPQGYLPSQLYNLDASKYGTQLQLMALLERLHEKRMRGMCDIVINHRCGDTQDSAGRWNVFHGGGPNGLGENVNWEGWAVVKGCRFADGTSQNGPTGEMYDAAPVIDHQNEKVKEGLTEWMRWLKLEIGFDAWRFDFTKGYGPQFVGGYCARTQPVWSVGEFWDSLRYSDGHLDYNQDENRQKLCNWIDGTGGRSCAFDFTTKGILQEAAKHGQFWRLIDRKGKPPGLIGWWSSRAVTFIDNHDTGSTQGHWPFPSDKVLLGYAYILTHPGIPCLFWDHIMDWGKDVRNGIKALTRARRLAGIKVDSKVQIEKAVDGLYFATVDNKLKVKLGKIMDIGKLCPPSDTWEVAAYGPEHCVWILRK